MEYTRYKKYQKALERALKQCPDHTNGITLHESDGEVESLYFVDEPSLPPNLTQPCLVEDDTPTPKKHRMHPAWGAFWWTWDAGIFVMLLFDAVFPEWWWLIAFGVFLFPEVIGAILPNRLGDTYSQSRWTISQGGLALRLFSACAGVGLAFKVWTLLWLLADLLGDGTVEWYDLMGWTPFIVGLAVWLWVHMLHLGKKG